MFRSAKYLLLLVSGVAAAQTQVKLNGIVVPATVSVGTTSAPGILQCDGTTTTCSGGVITSVVSGTGSGTVNSGTAFSPAFYPATGTAVSGTTPFTGIPFYSTSAAPRVSTASDFPTLNQPTTGNAATATTAGNLSGTPALPNGTTATTQTAGDNTTKLATDAFANAAATASNTTLLGSANTWTNTNTHTGKIVSTYAQTASTSGFLWNGVPLSGGTSTTAVPSAFYGLCSGSTVPTSWATAPAYIGLNSCSGSTSPFMDFHANGGSSVFRVGSDGTVTTTGAVNANAYGTSTSCVSSASPAVCGSSSSGFINIAAGSSLLTVNTTAVTANSQIFIQFDDSLSTALGVTCNTSSNTYFINGRTAGTSFVLKVVNTPATNPDCFSYFIVN